MKLITTQLNNKTNMNINYYRKNVYGVENLYLEDAEIAQGIRRLTGKKTVTHDDMSIMRNIFEVAFTEVIAPKV